MKYKLLCLAFLLFLAGCWTTRQAIQSGLEALIVNPTPRSERMAIRTIRPPPPPKTNWVVSWQWQRTDLNPFVEFDIIYATNLTGPWRYLATLDGGCRSYTNANVPFGPNRFYRAGVHWKKP